MELELKVNGHPARVDVRPDSRLLDVLRDSLGLTGTKEGCGRGECGACTVLADGVAQQSCLVLAARVREVETIEGLAEESRAFREALAETGGFQCGFCTPGHVVRAVALARGGVRGDDPRLPELISGNICRCTGYHAILAAHRRAGA